MATPPMIDITEKIKATKLARKLHAGNIVMDHGDYITVKLGEKEVEDISSYINTLVKQAYAKEVANMLPDHVTLYNKVNK